MGLPADIVAPTGGRAMIIRSTDQGKTWSKPVTLIDTPDDDRHRRMHVVGPTVPGAREARLAYRQLTVIKHDSWLEIELETGRKHQIRLQLSHHGHPVVGDRKYGSREPFPAGIALHARRLVISHPTTGARLEFEASLPDTWRQFDIR